MSTAEPRSPAGAILAQFAEGLRERAREVGVGHAEAPELVEPSFRGGDESTAARLRLDDLPEAALGLRFDGYTVLLGLLPEAPREEEISERLRKYRNQCVVARSHVAPDQGLDLHLFLAGPRGSERSESWRDLALKIERDDRVARKLVWLRPAESPEVDRADRESLVEFAKRTFLARPWLTTETFSMAPIDNVGRGVSLSGVPRDTIGDWNRLAASTDTDVSTLVDGLVEAWARGGRA